MLCGGPYSHIVYESNSMFNRRGKFVNVNNIAEHSSSDNGRTTANPFFQRTLRTCSRIQEANPLCLTDDDDDEDVQFDTSDSENNCEVLLAGKPYTSIQEFTSAVPNHLLLGSLLEHLCLVYERDPTRSRMLFKVIGQRLAGMNLLSPLAISDEFSTVRLQHNRAFTELFRAATSSLFPQDCKHLSTDPQSNLLRPKDGLFQAQTSRYLSEFEEISALGKGSYGKVFKVTNKLDGQCYAVKKILIRNVSRDDCMKVLREVKVLSSLQHPNIVGYHTAWMEHVQPGTDSKLPKEARLKPALPALERPSLRYPEDSSGSSNGSSIVFESSGCPRDSMPDDTHTSGSISQIDGPTGGESSKVVCPKVTRYPDHFVPCVYLGQPASTAAAFPVMAAAPSCWDSSVLSEEDFSGHRVERNNNSYIDVDSSQQWAESQPREVQFHLLLYIQMQLCERSLKDWIQEKNSKPIEELTHVTNAHRSLATEQLFHILRKILEGVQYIHSRGIMHRDLKSDMYSIGVIAVELFQPFGTEMERAHKLGELRQGKIPETLSQKWPILTKYIQLLTSQDPSERPSATQLLESELFSTKDKVIHSLMRKIDEQEEEINELRRRISELQGSQNNVQQMENTESPSASLPPS
ncbi:eukaryotic translation initiation factor 2-alpha kinase 1 isoform X4 [Alosa sapidissima]|uniref:eukaryotic translation initiation factor 2-alpha kinase 1 isoform X4 n=1 Tax=Alosa sapidissima TaxID=34773 RepID=UPI001C0917AD|nr:eukaryotic translation initiation factor 2-alpha kinase 1 isoform X4 [Alosa sapidissima]